MMKITGLVCSGLAVLSMGLMGCATDAASKRADYIALFDGETLANWSGDPRYWSVRDGVLVGEVTPETLLKRNSFIIWQGDMPPDFELTVDYRISTPGNSGINYRSEHIEGVPYALRGYQADLNGKNNHTGSTYEERRRAVIASQGESVILPALPEAAVLKDYTKGNHFRARKVVRSLGSRDELQAVIHADDWNEYRIVAHGNQLQHFVNGVLMSEVIDNDPVHRRMDGLLGVQVHVGPPMKVEYKNFRLKAL